jgi:hypothetical protein
MPQGGDRRGIKNDHRAGVLRLQVNYNSAVETAKIIHVYNYVHVKEMP